MSKTVFKELVVYVIVFLVLAVVMHPDLISMPLERLSFISERENYIHPFVYTLVAYLFVAMFRLFFRAVISVLKIYWKK